MTRSLLLLGLTITWAAASTNPCTRCLHDLAQTHIVESPSHQKAAAACAELCRVKAPTTECTGSADAAAPACYSGDIAFGAETLGTYIKDFKAGVGHMDVTGGGFLSVNCTNHEFTKQGQEIKVNVSDCVWGVTLSDIKYCSDQDISVLTLTYAGMPLTATLKRASPCPPA